MLLRCAALASDELSARVESWLDGVARVVAVSGLDDLRLELETDACELAAAARNADPASPPPWVEKTRALETRPDVIVLSEHEDPSERSAFLAAGCLGVIYLGLSPPEIEAALRGLARRAGEPRRPAVPVAPDERYRLSDYVTRSDAMRDFLRLARRVAGTDATALLLGETGVGKGLLARAIHNESARQDGPFVAVNCGALVDTLLESELFGHERGAFTGAHRARRGHFEIAGGGTLFLDEIGDLPVHLQNRLLTVIEDHAVRPVGSERLVPVDVRLIAATNRDLAAEVAEGRFRKDLYYRLNVLTLALPPLRERHADVAELVASHVPYFVERFHSPVRGVAQEALRALEGYRWPGNLRELRNVIERAVLLAIGDEIGLADLPPEIARSASAAAHGEQPERAADDEPEAEWLELPWRRARERVLADAERRYVAHALARTGGRVGEAAALAGIDPRALYEKARRHGLRKEDFRLRTGSASPLPKARSDDA